jgi:Fe-S-cluster containining protein
MIKDLYNEIPVSNCKNGCSECCTNMIQFSPSELKQMGGYEYNGVCSHLKNGKCSIYENRPFICRIFGTSELLKCEDCTPEKYLNEKETIELVHRYTLLRRNEESNNNGSV